VIPPVAGSRRSPRPTGNVPAISGTQDVLAQRDSRNDIFTCCHNNPNLASLQKAWEMTMSLKAVGVIDIPDSDGTLFDHGAFESRSRRVLWLIRLGTALR
jgi:hypothetical protein